jgi:hypothetical protein
LYVQDTYHATRRLVVNLGLRWEPFLPEFDHYDRGSKFSRPAFDAGQVSQVYANAPAGFLFAGDPGITYSFTDRRLANFSPRLGIVYDPTGSGKTTLRVGGALLYDSVGAFIPYRMVAQNPPYGPQVKLTSGPYQFSNPWGNVPGGNPVSARAAEQKRGFPAGQCGGLSRRARVHHAQIVVDRFGGDGGNPRHPDRHVAQADQRQPGDTAGIAVGQRSRSAGDQPDAVLSDGRAMAL